MKTDSSKVLCQSLSSESGNSSNRPLSTACLTGFSTFKTPVALALQSGLAYGINYVGTLSYLSKSTNNLSASLSFSSLDIGGPVSCFSASHRWPVIGLISGSKLFELVAKASLADCGISIPREASNPAAKPYPMFFVRFSASLPERTNMSSEIAIFRFWYGVVDSRSSLEDSVSDLPIGCFLSLSSGRRSHCMYLRGPSGATS